MWSYYRILVFCSWEATIVFLRSRWARTEIKEFVVNDLVVVSLLFFFPPQTKPPPFYAQLSGRSPQP